LAARKFKNPDEKKKEENRSWLSNPEEFEKEDFGKRHRAE